MSAITDVQWATIHARLLKLTEGLRPIISCTLEELSTVVAGFTEDAISDLDIRT